MRAFEPRDVGRLRGAHRRPWRSWRCNRRIGIALLWTLLVIGAAALASVAGIHLVGGVAQWETWMRTHAGYFLVWRLALYAVIACGWRWMRRRLQQREPAADTPSRLRRVEIAAVLAVVLLEASAWLRLR